MISVNRIGDMSPDDYINVHRQSDGDVVVTVVSTDRYSQKPTHSTVEFCVSGGRSPNTIKALNNLIEAIKKDHEENPI